MFVQSQGPTTGGGRIYDGHFHMDVRKPIAEPRLDV